MQFGHIDGELDAIDFSLPADTAMTKQNLAEATDSGDLQVFIGASKWNEKRWMGKIYPTNTPENALLPFYAKNFPVVEFGPSFYNIYTAEQISKWTQQIVNFPEFKFCPKFPQSITHIKRLKKTEELTESFYRSLDGFGDHLGPLMLQLPESFGPRSLPDLKTYLEVLPTAKKVNVELRNKGWFAESAIRADFFGLLRQLKMGTVISDTAGRRDCVHMELTTNEAMIRFVGNNLAASDYIRMDEWVERLSVWKDMGLKAVWFFMHQNNEGYVPEACDYFIKKLNSKLGTTVAGPNFL